MVRHPVRGQYGDLLVRGAEGLADHERSVNIAEHQRQFGRTGPGRGQHRDLRVRAADIGRPAQPPAVGAHHLGVVPGHPGPGEGRGDGGDRRQDLQFEAVLGAAQGADDAEESGVTLGHDHGRAPMVGDAPGDQGHTAEGHPFGAGRQSQILQLIAATGDQGRRVEC